MTENSDALWNDGVAPELALDFDLPNTSTAEAMWTWVGGFSCFFILFLGIKAVTTDDDNPALPHSTERLVPDYSDHAAAPLEE
jgi:hypothetical protein